MRPPSRKPLASRTAPKAGIKPNSTAAAKVAKRMKATTRPSLANWIDTRSPGATAFLRIQPDIVDDTKMVVIRGNTQEFLAFDREAYFLIKY